MSFQYQFGTPAHALDLMQPGVARATQIPAQSRILLLQGPVGPFFAELEQHLSAQGHRVTRVHFNAGDKVFRRRAAKGRGEQVFMAGGLRDWQRWLQVKLITGAYDSIILFGADRPAHRIARKLASTYGCKVIALEEGYIRPGFITVETGGNNAGSPLAGKLPPRGWYAPSHPMAPGFRHSMRRMVAFSAIYFTFRQLFSTPAQRETFHRDTPLIAESRAWIRNFWRWLRFRGREGRQTADLMTRLTGRYFLVPLQVASDSNMADAALGWNSRRLIDESIRSFAADAPARAHLVFKIHPMERGHNRLTPAIHDLAREFGLGDRVHVVETGSLGELARHAAGMITITSSSGLSAIHHGTKLMVIGRALYAHPALAICANGRPDFRAFWASDFSPTPALRQRYLAWLRASALQIGDFYAPAGRVQACNAVANVLVQSVRDDAVALDDLVAAPQSGRAAIAL